MRQRSSLEIFRNSLWFFILREIKARFGATRLGYFWALLDPALAVAFFVLMHAVIRGHDQPIYGESAIFFFTYGSVVYFGFMHTVSAQAGKLGASRGLFNYRQIRPIDVLLANSLLEFGLMVAVFGVFILGAWVFGAPTQIHDVAQLLAVAALVLLLGTALGLCFEVNATVTPDLRRIFAVIMRPLFFLSGTFYSIEMIPLKYRDYLLWNPVLHLVDLAREACMPEYVSPASWGYVVVFTAVTLFVGLASYRRHMHSIT